LWNLGRTAWRRRPLAALGGLALVLACLGLAPLAVLLGAGLGAFGLDWLRRHRSWTGSLALWLPLLMFALLGGMSRDGWLIVRLPFLQRPLWKVWIRSRL